MKTNYSDILEISPKQNSSMERVVEHLSKLFMDFYGIDFWVAGGSVRDLLVREKVSDYDVFFASQNDYDTFLDILQEKPGYEVILENENALKAKFGAHKIDLVKIFNASPRETLRRFDFTVTQFAVRRNAFYTTVEALTDLAGRRLVVSNPTHPVATMRRLAKYVAKGYRPCAGTMMDLGKAVNGLTTDEFEQDKTFYID